KIDAFFDVVARDTNDMLMSQTSPSILGVGAPASNAADLRITSRQLALTWRDRTRWVLLYNVTLALSDLTAVIIQFDNLIGAIPSGITASGNSAQYYVGQKLGEIWGYETVGIFQTEDEVAAAPNQSALGANWRPGDIQYKDLNGDGVINPGNNTLANPGDRKV